MAKTRQLQVKTPRPVKKVHIYKSSLQKCSFCQRALICKKSRSIAQGRLFSSESITAIASQAKYCPKCRFYMRCNFVWLGGQKINCMTFNQLQKSGLYFVTSNTAFTMKYLELCYLRLLRAKTSPGQEASCEEHCRWRSCWNVLEWLLAQASVACPWGVRSGQAPAR